MTSSRAPIDSHAETELHRRIHAESPYWGMIYQAMLGQLTDYVDVAVAQALAAHGLVAGRTHQAAARGRAAGGDESHNGFHGATHRVSHGQALQGEAPLAAQPVAVPPWLQPFTLPEKVRFTRTPDAFLRTERPAPAAPEQPRFFEETEARFEPQPPQGEADLPAWRKPFTLPPNVRINRTPERRAAGEEHPTTGLARHRAEPGSEIAAASAPPAVARQGEAEAVPAFVEPAAPQAAAPVWFGIVRAERAEFLRQADEQDNASLELASLEPSDGAFTDEMIATAWLMNHQPTPDQEVAASPPEQDDLEPEASPEEHRGQACLHESDEPEAAQAGGPDAEQPEGPAQTATATSEPARPESTESTAAAVVRLPRRPTGIASPEDARTFVGPARGGAGRKAGVAHGLGPFEQAGRVNTDPALWEDPPLELLVEPPAVSAAAELSSGALEQNARLLEGVLEEFGVRGEIIDVRPGPVVTLYELEPAPGTKSSRVIGLSDDIARSMSAVSARVAVVQGRNVIGIELPNQRRETVFLRALLGADDFGGSKHKLAIALGKTIGGEPIIVDLARMPHLLVAGTTGSGKSVAINTMILSLLYRLRPDECRLIMIDPKMLELSVYEGIPHLLTPVVTDPKKAVVALKWAVREMEDRYKKMSKVGVRNIDGFNARVAEAAQKGETITRTVQTGFNRETGEAIFETEEMELAPLPYIVVIVDEMADLMMVAGKDIEGAIQRLAQMARAAGIHLIMATQRPSVDVITGTIKANFPTRISFQVTSKIDSRTILGEQGAEQLLGQGDMLYMAGGGRISRVHGPFVSDGEVEKVVAHLKLQGHPDYLDVVVAEEEGGEQKPEVPDDKPVFERGAMSEDDNDLYEQAVKVVLRDKKCSTSYIQRRLQVGYNKAASLVERMEKEGLVGQANNAGKREILVYSRDLRFTESRDTED